MPVDKELKELVAALLRRRDHLRKSGADQAKLAEVDFDLASAGHVEPSESAADEPAEADSSDVATKPADKPKSRSAKAADAETSSDDEDKPVDTKFSGVTTEGPKGRSAPQKSNT